MLEELKKHHPSGFTRPNDSNTVAPQRSNTKQSVARRKSRNLVKVDGFFSPDTLIASNDCILDVHTMAAGCSASIER